MVLRNCAVREVQINFTFIFNYMAACHMCGFKLVTTQIGINQARAN